MTRLDRSIVSCFLFLAAFLLFAMADRPALSAPKSETACRGDGKRLALLIGNQDYMLPMSRLFNPRSDISAFGELLCNNNFTVFRHSDLELSGFDRAILDFQEQTTAAETAIIYYSGHGFAAGGRNWLAPVDATLRCADLGTSERADISVLKRKLIDVSEDLLRRLGTTRNQIVILDACRTEPIQACHRSGGALTLVKAFRSIRDRRAVRRLIVYATQDGEAALDGVRDSPNSPLMTALLSRLKADPSRNWRDTMDYVNEEVNLTTEGEQLPNLDVSLWPEGCLAMPCNVSNGALPPTHPPMSLTMPEGAPALDYVAMIKRCDAEASLPNDRDRPQGVIGKPIGKVSAKEAVEACFVAVRSAPNERRLHFQLGRGYQAGNNFSEAIQEYKFAADAGSISAMLTLGKIYRTGIGSRYGIPKDVSSAASWYEKGGQAGSSLAAYNAGVMHDVGNLENFRQAMRWYERAFALNNKNDEAIFAIATMYETGRSGQQDSRLAREWFEQAARLGNKDAIDRLGGSVPYSVRPRPGLFNKLFD